MVSSWSRTKTSIGTVTLASTAMLLSACGGGVATPVLDRYPPAQIDTADNVKYWAGASAPNVYIFPIAVIAIGMVSGGPMGPMTDPSCPVVTRNGDTTVYRGGCTDRNGKTWHGTLTTVGVSFSIDSGSMTTSRPVRSGSMNFEDFGFTGMQTCNGMQVQNQMRLRGTWTVSDAGNNRANFRVDITGSMTGANTDRGCMPESAEFAMEYSGSYTLSGEDRDGDGSPDVQTWNGSGRLGDSRRGTVQAQTTDEVIDSRRCSYEALSGTTTLRSGSNTAVITYDGATNCSENSTVRWSYNGMDMGELQGVRCTVSATPGRGRGTLALFACAAALALARRRQNRR